MNQDYLVSTVSGDIYLGEKDDPENPTSQFDNSYFVSKSQMREFLIRAADEIDTFDDFEQDPIEKFPIRHKLYYC